MAAITSQWWRRLVNAYEVKVGMGVCSEKKLIHIGALQRRVSYNGAPYKPLYFTYNINSADNAIQHSFIYV